MGPLLSIQVCGPLESIPCSSVLCTFAVNAQPPCGNYSNAELIFFSSSGRAREGGKKSRKYGIWVSPELFCFIASFHLFVQVKSYARFNDQRNEYDKGYVSIAYSLSIEGSYYNEPDTTARHLYCLSLMLTFTFLKLIFLFQLLLQNQCSCIIPK